MAKPIINKDVVVVGLGAFGSGAVWRLASRGVDVAGIDRFSIGHNLGSSHGITRLFRIVCMEHPGLSPIARKSLSLWRELGAKYDRELVTQTGCLATGKPDSETITGFEAAAEVAGVDVQRFTAEELKERYPGYGIFEDDYVGLLDPEAGVCYPERNVTTHLEEAEALGADLYMDTRVLSVESGDDGVTVETSLATFKARKAIVSTGAWVGKFFPELPLSPRRTPLNWFVAKPGHEEEYEISKFPAFTTRLPDGTALWGHGSNDEWDIKIGLLDDAPSYLETDADKTDRYIHLKGLDTEELNGYVGQAFPGISLPQDRSIPCMITNSPDHQFLVGELDAHPGIIVAGGDSGHGFKHAAGVGELLAQLAIDEDVYTPIDFMDPNRYAGTTTVEDGAEA